MQPQRPRWPCRRPVAAALLALAAAAQAPAATALTIAFNGSAPAPALAALGRAAAEWTARIADPVTVTIDIGYGTFATNIIGQASSIELSTRKNGYGIVRDALLADADADDEIVAALPSLSQLINEVHLPNGITFNGGIVATKANFKALGFTGLDAQFGVSDGAIQFNQVFSFDFDRSNGVSGTDFQTVATHEIGHILGFDSIVDSIDAALAQGAQGSTEIYPLDLFRFGLTAIPQTAAGFTAATRELTPGVEAVFGDSVNNFRMSTGVTHGDHQQASHFKDDRALGVRLGIMNPTLAQNVAFGISPADLRVLDLIGWDVTPVPLPPALLLLAPALALLAGHRRRRG